MWLLLCLCLCSDALSSNQSTSKTENDYVKIGYIPARGAVFKGEPYTKMEAQVASHHKNKQIKIFFDALRQISDSGTIDNATQFHQATVYLEVQFQGQTLRISYVGASKLERYNEYESQWRDLHRRIFEFIIENLNPEH